MNLKWTALEPVSLHQMQSAAEFGDHWEATGRALVFHQRGGNGTRVPFTVNTCEHTGHLGFGHSFAIEVLRYSRLRTTPRTILVVDDHRVFLQLVTTILEGAHFTVLPAATPKEALRIEAGYKGRIDLLLSDVMMPTMNGPELAHKLKVRRPGIRILLMSLFDNGSVLLLNHGWHFIQKPFLADALLTRVNELLKSRPRRQAPVHFDTRKVGPRRAEA